MGSAAASMGLTWMINSYFYGRIGAAMPFQPWGMVSGMSHRGIEGDDLSQCGMTFIFILLSMSFRGLPSKLLGVEAPRMPMDLQTP